MKTKVTHNGMDISQIIPLLVTHSTKSLNKGAELRYSIILFAWWMVFNCLQTSSDEYKQWRVNICINPLEIVQ